MLSKAFFESVYKLNENKPSKNYDYICDSRAIGGCGALGYTYYCTLDSEVAIETIGENGEKKVVTGILLGYNEHQKEPEKTDWDIADEYAKEIINIHGKEKLHNILLDGLGPYDSRNYEKFEDYVKPLIKEWLSKNTDKADDKDFFKKVLQQVVKNENYWG